MVCGLRAVAACIVAALVLSPTLARAQGFQTTAPHAIVMDFETGTVLFEKAADTLMAPASMVKVMTAAVVFDEMRKGRLSLDSEFVVSENAWRRGGAPSGGSTMFAALGSRIKVSDLLPGLIVQSGNDAAIILAEGIAGTEEAFARLMNRRGREIGLGRAEFRNSTGAGHPEQKMTARELAMLSRHVIETYPDLYPVFGRADFTWNKIRQQNRNPLLTMNIGADGLKTGNIAEAGFGLVGSAVQDGRRLIVVVNGLANARDRAQEARKLLDYGFRSFEARDLYAAGQPVGEVRVFGGQERSVPVAARGLVRILLPRGSAERISVRLGYSGPLLPPVREGDRVATLRVYRGDTLILETPLHAVRSMDKGSLMRRAFDAAEEAIGGWLRGAFAKL